MCRMKQPSSTAGTTTSANIDRQEAALPKEAVCAMALQPERLAQPTSTPPNIVYFVTDDQDQMLGASFPTMAPNGATPLPKVKALMADGGAQLENMFIHVPICNPSRSTTLTGRYFHNIKTTNSTWGAMHCDMDKVHNHSFAVRLQKKGYTLGLFGKYLNAMPGNAWNVSKPDAFVPAGWSAWYANGGGSYIASGFATSGLKEAAGIEDGAIQLDNSPANYSTSAIGNVSMAWIRHTVKMNKGPFFAYIAPKAAHEPFDPAPWYVDAWDPSWPTHEPRPVNWNCSTEQRRDHAGVVATQPMLSAEAADVVTGVFKNRWRTLMSVDDLISDVVHLVETELGLADSTYFLYSSDHGFQLGQFNILMDKRHVYDWTTRIHLLVRGPGIAPGTRIAQPATNVDLAPTFLHLAEPSACDAAGRCVGGSASAHANATAPLDGRSLVPLLFASSRAAAAASWRREAYIEYYFNDANIKCVDNCSSNPGQRAYPTRDADCTELVSEPNDVCWGPVCDTGCYPTEDDNNNFIGIRKVGGAGDGTLYAEYQEGSQSKVDIDFSAPTFYELFNAKNDTWLMTNLHATADAGTKTALHADLHAWYGCVGATCP